MISGDLLEKSTNTNIINTNDLYIFNIVGKFIKVNQSIQWKSSEDTVSE